RKTLNALVAPLVASLVMMSGVQLAKPVALKLFGFSEHNFVTLSILVALGAIIYLGVALIFQRALLAELLQLGRSAFSNGRRRRVPELAPK
ncbi:hypothetical protein KC963_04695, partial [Candidatus Saccharibacteria bacterium]|nr:hypothetical protein [Candidatus Saccharibacteria bacterium]